MSSNSLTKYQMFVYAIDEKSLSRAAKKMGCTQSAVSHGIQSLEKELGFALMVRSKSGLRLTAEGERILPTIRGILSGQVRRAGQRRNQPPGNGDHTE